VAVDRLAGGDCGVPGLDHDLGGARRRLPGTAERRGAV
jgi:hypothetical protein